MTKRRIEIFSAGCPICDGIVSEIRHAAHPSWEITVLDMHDDRVAERAKSLGLKSVPAVVVDGKVADCCAGRGVDMDILRSIGQGNRES